MDHVCPVAKVIKLLGKKWNLAILHQFSTKGDRIRFGEFICELKPISSRTLSRRLKELEKAGLLSSERFNEVPPRVEYYLTPSGKALTECFGHIGEWAKRYG